MATKTVNASESDARRAGEWVNQSLDKALLEGVQRAYSHFGADMAAMREAALGNVQFAETHRGKMQSYGCGVIKNATQKKRRPHK